MESGKSSSVLLGHLLLATTAILWGSSYIGTRAIVGEVPPLLLGALRALLATLVLGLVAKGRGEQLRVSVQSWWPIVGLGVLGVGYFYLGLNLALQWTTATTASLLSLPYPALSALGAWFFLHEPLNRWQASGIILAGIGATWLTIHTAQPEIGGSWLSNLLALSITFAWTAYTLLGRRVLPHWSPLTATFHIMLAGTLVLSIGAGMEWWAGAKACWTIKTLLVTLYLGVVCTGLGYAFWNYGLGLVPAAAASVYLYLQPVTVLVLAILLLGEQPTADILVAGGLVLLGTVLTAQYFGARQDFQYTDHRLNEAAADAIRQPQLGGKPEQWRSQKPH